MQLPRAQRRVRAMMAMMAAAVWRRVWRLLAAGY